MKASAIVILALLSVCSFAKDIYDSPKFEWSGKDMPETKMTQENLDDSYRFKVLEKEVQERNTASEEESSEDAVRETASEDISDPKPKMWKFDPDSE